jgi:hypothetical protein
MKGLSHDFLQRKKKTVVPCGLKSSMELCGHTVDSTLGSISDCFELVCSKIKILLVVK